MAKKKKMSDKDRYTIIQPAFINRCFICMSNYRVAKHEIFFGSANRQKSIEDGMVVELCGIHHNLSSQGVHFNDKLDTYLKKFGEKKWIQNYTEGSLKEGISDFIKRYGKNYLDDEDLKDI